MLAIGTATNLVVEQSTGCRDESAARQVLADLERKAERIRAGLITPAEARTVEHQHVPIGEHVAAYIESMKARGVVEMHRDNTRRHLETLNKAMRLRPPRRPEPRSPGAMARRRSRQQPLGPIPQRPPNRDRLVL